MRRFVPLLAAIALTLSAAAGENGRETLERIKDDHRYQRWRSVNAREEWPTLPDLPPRQEREEKKREKREKREPRGRRAIASPINLGGALRYFGYGILAVAAIAVVVVAYRYFMAAKRPKKNNAKKKVKVEAAKALAEGDALAMADDEWDAEARMLLAGGDIRLAYRSLYLGLLSGLHARGLIHFARTRTNWHYVTYFRGTADQKSEFAALTGVFDRVWYGFSTEIATRGGNGFELLSSRVKQLMESGNGDEQ